MTNELPARDYAPPEPTIPPFVLAALGAADAPRSAAGCVVSARPAPGPVSQLLVDLARVPAFDTPVRAQRAFRPGDVVGRFALRREVGRGGFGVVFKARDRELGRWVAVKTIRPGAPLAAARESLLREIEAARLQHPNIVRMLEDGRCDRGPYVVFEYLEGETLGERLTRGPLTVTELIEVAVAVTRALAYAHAHGVLHRDLKPGNVFLTSAGGAKVIDFGLASVAGSGGPPGSGTSRYMSPEQRSGAPEDARTDLFALGLVIHEMATGKALLDSDGARHPGVPASAPLVPPALERLVAALVERDPARRPGSADEVLRRLREVQRPLVPRASWWRHRCRRCATGERALHAGAAAAPRYPSASVGMAWRV